MHSLSFSRLAVIALVALACSSAAALHMPRHTTLGLRPLRSIAMGARPRPLAPSSTKPTLSVEERIAQENDAIQACLADRECAVEEAEVLKQQLRAFVDSGGWSKVSASPAHARQYHTPLLLFWPSALPPGHVFAQLMNALSWKSMRTRVHAIVQRRRDLVQKAETARIEAGQHEQMKERLERVHSRLQRRWVAALDARWMRDRWASGERV